jgi:myosin heavy subunit
MFNHHIFKLEQEEYNKEKINWEKVNFKDNQDCIDLIEKVRASNFLFCNPKKKPMGVLSLLDEECRFPKGSDKTLLEKLHQNHAKHPNYEAPKKAGNHFIVKHYAGEDTTLLRTNINTNN